MARFTQAWLLPTAVAVGLFWIVCIPALADASVWPVLTGAAHGALKARGLGEAFGLAAFTVLSLSVVLAYSSQLIYRILEGYHLPQWLDQSLTRRQQCRVRRLMALKTALERNPAGPKSKAYGIALEQLGLYPPAVESIMPTRLGNALKTLEAFGLDRYGLDSQQFWFELVGTAESSIRQENEEMRAQVDLFVAALAVFALLVIASLVTAVESNEPRAPALLAAGAALFLPIAYKGALRNMKDWVNSTRAMINLGRHRVASGMGLVVPRRLDDEVRMWQATSAVLHYRDERWRPWLDVFRVDPAKVGSSPTEPLTTGAGSETPS